MLLRLLLLARAPVELAEAEVAVGDERAHAEHIGQIEGLTIKSLRFLEVWRRAPGGNVSENPQDPCLKATGTDAPAGVEGRTRIHLGEHLLRPDYDQRPSGATALVRCLFEEGQPPSSTRPASDGLSDLSPFARARMRILRKPNRTRGRAAGHPRDGCADPRGGTRQQSSGWLDDLLVDVLDVDIDPLTIAANPVLRHPGLILRSQQVGNLGLHFIQRRAVRGRLLHGGDQVGQVVLQERDMALRRDVAVAKCSFASCCLPVRR